ncbi:MAG TPA: DUF4010 domain-containing protein [Ktedonobacteraceae bacterium]|jgi:uncharacterized membrane protein (DUF4010 family)
MDISVTVALKLAASAGIGLLLGMERELAHKEAGVRTFAIAALLGTLSWLLSPALALIQFAMVVLVALIINAYAFWKTRHMQITTSLALAATSVLGIAVGAGDFFLAFAGAIAITALLSWKTELITLSGSLSEREIRGALLLAFISFVIYPLLPGQPVDPWKILDLRAVWLTVIVVSALKFVNYVLLRVFGERGLRYSSLLGGLVNSAAMALFLGEEGRKNEHALADAPENMLLAGAAMILRNWVLVLLFSAPRGWPRTLPTLLILVPMTLVAGAIAGLIAWRTRRAANQSQGAEREDMASSQEQEQEQEKEAPETGKAQEPRGQATKKRVLKSPLSAGSVLAFALIFLTLTVFSGTGRILFGATGFLVVIVIGALASAASAAALLGSQLAAGLLPGGPAAIALFLATVAGLLENVGIFWFVARTSATGRRILLLILPVIASGLLMALLLTFFHW